MNSVVRPWSNDPGLINRYLSCGAGGVQAPHVHNAADARNIVEGLRRWGDGNYEDKLLVVMIESQQGVDNLPTRDEENDCSTSGERLRVQGSREAQGPKVQAHGRGRHQERFG